MRAPPPHSSLLHQPRKARSHTAVYFCRGHTADAQEQQALATPARKEQNQGVWSRQGPVLGTIPMSRWTCQARVVAEGPDHQDSPWWPDMAMREPGTGQGQGGPGRAASHLLTRPQQQGWGHPEKLATGQGLEERAHGHAQAQWRCSLGASPKGHQEGVTLPALTLHQPWLLLGTGVLIFMLNMHNSACSTCPGHLLLNSSMSA